ncbi:protoporphyrinogen oxidase, variant [Aphanomyces invadans]|nr:protoporphyrinogen oxidase, variant [Aphanomyces invadans]ETV95493.1 protoporphyrinogen oxidase, variant [Aphanomyces invadans]|eukprot:XP_008875686.1 protoporphyrinogen oxidase, variant [Aphanomyces invadans]
MDESVYTFISRRFSPAIAERLLDPMVSGIFAGNIRHLSMRSCFGRLWDMEQSHGSIVRAMLFHGTPMPTTLLDGTKVSSFVEDGSKAISMSFTHGMQSLTDALATHIEASPHTDIRLNTTVESLTPSSTTAKASGVAVRVRDAGATAAETVVADHVFSALPAHRLAPLVHAAAPSVATALSRLPFTSLGVVTLGFERNIIQRPGFGYLVPSCEKEGILGVIYDSSSFPQQNFGKNVSRLSVFLGGENHPSVAAMPRAKREEMALETIQRHLGVSDTPVHVESTWYDHAIPQYPVGFHENVAELEADVAETFDSALTLVGNSFYGVGLADCVHRSTAAALAFAASHRSEGCV